MDTGSNKPGEFLIACVDERGKLHQYCSTDSEVASDLLVICHTGESVTRRLLAQARLENARAARERGDTPEMPRMAPAQLDEGAAPAIRARQVPPAIRPQESDASA